RCAAARSRRRLRWPSCGGGVRRVDAASFCCTDPAPPEVYPLSLHDALPISRRARGQPVARPRAARRVECCPGLEGEADSRGARLDRKSTRLNSSHVSMSYADFCLKKKTPVTAPSRTEPPCPPSISAAGAPLP